MIEFNNPSPDASFLRLRRAPTHTVVGSIAPPDSSASTVRGQLSPRNPERDLQCPQAVYPAIAARANNADSVIDRSTL